MFSSSSTIRIWLIVESLQRFVKRLQRGYRALTGAA